MTTKTPISALQELMAAKKLQLPIYIEEPMNTSFKCTVYAAGITAVGIGSSKKAAKQESAKNALEQLGAALKPQQIIILDSSPPPLISTPFRNYVGELNIFSSQHGFQYPDYDLVGAINGFFIKCKFVGKEVMGKGSNKKDAKQDAAKNMLELINLEPLKAINNEFRIIQAKSTPVENHEEIITLYKKLAVNEPQFPSLKSGDFTVTHLVHVSEEESIDDLKKKLNCYGLLYSIKEIQQNPYVVYINIKGTQLHFVGSDPVLDQAIKKALRQVVETAESGCPLNNDLISLSD